MNLTNLGQQGGQVFLSGLAFVLVSALVFWPLEALLEGPKSARPSLKDLAYMWFYQSYGLWIGAGLIFELAFQFREHIPPWWLAVVARQPYWLQVVVALTLAEMWVYVMHRLAHRWDRLWKYHSVHHSLVDMTWSAASRQHPFDFFLTIVGANLPAMLLGVDLRSVALFVILERLYTVFLHSNLNVDYGWFNRIIASPRLHATHHNPDFHDKNFAGLLSLLDVIGGTFQELPKESSTRSS